MTNKERYQRAFSSLHTSENFKVRLEDNAMAAKYFKMLYLGWTRRKELILSQTEMEMSWKRAVVSR